jgi:hypothetical protein
MRNLVGVGRAFSVARIARRTGIFYSSAATCSAAAPDSGPRGWPPWLIWSVHSAGPGASHRLIGRIPTRLVTSLPRAADGFADRGCRS